ncbi:MAG: sulfatase [Planctomycetota bacterium]|jgi:arylsulfatase A-like enzyme
MKLSEGLRQGVLAGPALGAVVGLLDCLRAAAEGGTVLGPRHWLFAVAIYALFWIPLGLLAGLAAGLVFRRAGRAACLLVTLGTAAFAYGAYRNIVHLPAFTSPESLRFDAILLGATAAAFFLLHLLPVPVPEPRARTWLALLLLPLAVAAAAGLASPAPDHDPVEVRVEPGERPNVLVLLVDTLRADHLGAYGYERPTSPSFDRLARESALFTRCRVASTWTKPSTASILTGLLPTAHGAVEHREILPDEAVTLAEVFRSAGYRTAAWSDNPFVSPDFGFGQGFESFDGAEPSVFVNGTLLGKALWTLRVVSLSGRLVGEKLATDRGSAELTRRLLGWIDGLEAGAPWFAYLHVMEPHLPYDPPAPFRGRFADPSYSGPDLDRPPRYLGFLPFERAEPLPEDRRRHLVARYDEEILCWDAALGDLVAGLRRRGLLDSSVVVVLSDHGEEFYEHGGWTHGHSLYEELIRVPLLIRAPGLAPRRIDAPVRATDLYPTLLSLSGLEAESPPFGVDLARAVRRGADVAKAPVVAEVRIGGAGARAIVSGTEKLVIARHGEKVVREAFDLAADPEERRTVPAPYWAARLGRRLDDVLRLAGALALEARARDLTPEEEDLLEGLGYTR